MAWNDERVAALTKLWRDGLSASQIAGRLGGVTRNAVISKIHRLGLSGRSTHPGSRGRNGKPHSNRPRKSYQRQVSTHPVFAPAPYRPPPEIIVVPPQERKRLEDLENADCRWPCTSAPPHAFCARRRVPGLPYCREHAQVAYQVAVPREMAEVAGEREKVPA